VIRWEVPPSRRIAFVVVLGVVALSVLVTVTIDFRLGGYLLGAALLMAATMRLVLPAKYCLGLLVRSRQSDVLTALLLGLAIVVVAYLVPAH
jgi:hypothetical protein